MGTDWSRHKVLRLRRGLDAARRRGRAARSSQRINRLCRSQNATPILVTQVLADVERAGEPDRRAAVLRRRDRRRGAPRARAARPRRRRRAAARAAAGVPARALLPARLRGTRRAGADRPRRPRDPATPSTPARRERRDRAESTTASRWRSCASPASRRLAAELAARRTTATPPRRLRRTGADRSRRARTPTRSRALGAVLADLPVRRQRERTPQLPRVRRRRSTAIR